MKHNLPIKAAAVDAVAVVMAAAAITVAMAVNKSVDYPIAYK